jgi:hypothetical protein
MLQLKLALHTRKHDKFSKRLDRSATLILGIPMATLSSLPSELLRKRSMRVKLGWREKLGSWLSRNFTVVTWWPLLNRF